MAESLAVSQYRFTGRIHWPNSLAEFIGRFTGRFTGRFAGRFAGRIHLSDRRATWRRLVGVLLEGVLGNACG